MSAAVGERMPRAGASVFDLRDERAWQRWRRRKLETQPRDVSDLLVEVRDPRNLSRGEHDAIVERCRRANMAIYASPVVDDDPAIVHRLGVQLGLRRLDTNLLAEPDGITRITVTREKAVAGYIPYTARRMLWHTDGYYNPPALRVRAMLLHCVRPAACGGSNALFDHEMAWLLLRDIDAQLVEALMSPDALAIPARIDEDGLARAAACGPVFSVEPASGDLAMRFTARRRSVEWKRDAIVSQAAARLLALLDGESRCAMRVRLEAGMGIVCNN
ncbi:MAG: TauD/TfdA family dioxygenase, partial [Bacillota bacterium]